MRQAHTDKPKGNAFRPKANIFQPEGQAFRRSASLSASVIFFFVAFAMAPSAIAPSSLATAFSDLDASASSNSSPRDPATEIPLPGTHDSYNARDRQSGSDRVDPFYEKLLDDGKFFFNSGNYAQAIENFEIAFFGFLDHHLKLLECFIYLTVSHFKLKDLEKTKHYLDEIDRMKLRDHLEELELPEDLADAFREVIAYLDRLGRRAKTGRLPPSAELPLPLPH